ncbi:IclR family transcriptional regulator [Alloalcanivorax dieselolei]|nr:IclR family transcriptional regulator [Alloalcanivorax dieselolei]GGJ76460.1 IclR family transcriptional regulator [Alloalcanivorax dieselolei]
MSGKTSKRRVPAIDRAVRILDFVAASGRVPGVSELARTLQLPKSSVHGICETLVELGLLQSSTDGFEPGGRSLLWSSAFLDRMDIVREFENLLSQDRRLDDFTVTLSTMADGDVVYLACRNATKPLGFTFQIGMRLPAIYTATGKAMLAAMPKAARQRIVTEYWAAPLTDNAVKDASSFEEEAVRWRGLGYALDRGEIREGMVCLGAAIMDIQGQPAAGIAISMTSAEAKKDKIKRYGAIISELAAKLVCR